jgi:hypothetical protein
LTVRKTDGQHDLSGLEGRIIKSRTRVLLCGGKLFMLRAPHVTAPAMTTAGAVGYAQNRIRCEPGACSPSRVTRSVHRGPAGRLLLA